MISFIRRNLVECVAGLVVFFVLAAIFFPMPDGSKEAARRSSCVNNLRQIGTGLMQYAQDNDEFLPRLANGKTKDGKDFTWRLASLEYMRDVGIWKCPSNKAAKIDSVIDGLPLGYEVVDCGPIRRGKPLSMSDIKKPSVTFLAFEENAIDALAHINGASWDKDDGSEAATNVLFAGHLGTGNYLFADGHVKSMRPMKTVANGVNMWHVDNKAKVTLRVWQKLKVAQETADK